MNPFEYALQMERDGYDFYMEAAESLQDKSARRMLMYLAEDEKDHQRYLEEMKEGGKVKVKTHISGEVKNIFKELKESNGSFVNENDDLKSVLLKGVELECLSAQQYEKFASETDNADEKEFWTHLVKVERKHEKLLQLTHDYIDQPGTVLEDAEFLFYGLEGDTM